MAKATAGKERNKEIKKYIKEIIYSPEEIEIQLYYRNYSVEDATSASSAQALLGVEKCRAEDPPESAGDCEALGVGSDINNEFDRLVSLKKLEVVPVSRNFQLLQ